MNKENEGFNLQEVGCKAHQNKKAKYKIVGTTFNKSKFNLMDLVCSKCAITLISQGYKVENIESDETLMRQDQIQQFLETISQTYLIINQNEQNLLQKEDLTKFCEMQKDKVREHYTSMRIALDNKLKEQIDYLNELQYKAITLFDQKYQEITETHNELIQMQSDIEVNLENIILKMEVLPYKQIMGSYNKRVTEIQQCLTKLGTCKVVLGRVYKRAAETKILGGLFEDCELEIKIAQTSLLKTEQQSNSRLLSPQSMSQTNIMHQTPEKQKRSNSQSSKFLEILNKVNENQLKTNNFYTQLLKGETSLELSERYCSPTFKSEQFIKYFIKYDFP